MEDLQGPLFGALQQFTTVFAYQIGAVAYRGEAGVQAYRQRLFALAPLRIGGVLLLLEDSIFFQAEQVEFVAEGEMLGEDLGKIQGVGGGNSAGGMGPRSRT